MSAIAAAPGRPALVTGRSIPSLDGFRALAIACVIGDHVLAARGLAVAPLGSLGVRVFFVLSGFLITRLLLTELEAKGKINLARFYLRRTIRIFPAFYAFLIVLALLSALGLVALNAHDLLESSTYTVNYFPFDTQSPVVRHIWSLSNEEQFYLLWPVCLSLAGARKARWGLLAVILAEPLIRFAVWSAGPPLVLTIDRRFDCLADTLATGCLLASLSKPLGDYRRYLRFLNSPWFFAVPLIVGIAAITAIHPRIYYVVSETVMNVGIALCMDRWIRSPAGGIGRILNLPVVARVGVMSYSLYLWQQLFLTEGTQWWHSWPANLILAAAVATASFSLIEQPFQRLKNKTAARRV